MEPDFEVPLQAPALERPTLENVQAELTANELKWTAVQHNNFLHVKFEDYSGYIDDAKTEFNKLWYDYYKPKPGGQNFTFGKGYILCINVYRRFEVFDANAVEGNGYVGKRGELLGTVSRLVTAPDDVQFGKDRWFTQSVLGQSLENTRRYMFTAGIQKVTSRRFPGISPRRRMLLADARQAVKEAWTQMPEPSRPQDCYIVVQAWERKWDAMKKRNILYMTGFQYKKILKYSNDFDAAEWYTQRNKMYDIGGLDFDEEYRIEVKVLTARDFHTLYIPITYLSFFALYFTQFLPDGIGGDQGDEERMFSDYASEMSNALLLLCI